jgi:hypothetical protein
MSHARIDINILLGIVHGEICSFGLALGLFNNAFTTAWIIQNG